MSKPEDIKTEMINIQMASLQNESQLGAILGTRKQPEFREYIEELLRKKKKERSEIAFIVENTMTQAHLYSILNGNRKPVNRVHVIAIGLALKLDAKGIDDLLKNAGHKPLDAKRNIGDACIIFGISKGYNYEDMNRLLHKNKAEYVLF